VNLVAAGLITGLFAIVLYWIFLLVITRALPGALVWLPVLIVRQILFTARRELVFGGVGSLRPRPGADHRFRADAFVSFLGTSENAVKTQIWIAVSVYVLVAIVRKRLGLEISLYQILQILSVMLFEKTPILRALQPPDSQNDLLDSANQLILFDL
jgi:hypothetical protein